MNLSDFTYIINNPDAINSHHTNQLDTIVGEFPYFQAARALRLKGLYKEDSFRYNYALKITAAYTTDRGVLFDFITSEMFTSVNKSVYENKKLELKEMIVHDAQTLQLESHDPENDLEDDLTEDGKAEIGESEIGEEQQTASLLPDPARASILESILQANVDFTVVEVEGLAPEPGIIDVPEVAESETPRETQSAKLHLGKPFDFTPGEKHSFGEWLQLSNLKKIDRSAEDENSGSDYVPKNSFQANGERQKKNALIDRFIASNPKIAPVKKEAAAQLLQVEPSQASDNSYLMTETLARVYLEQKKYEKAIQAYEILILKYPEKSSFFADRILDIRNLKNNNI